MKGILFALLSCLISCLICQPSYSEFSPHEVMPASKGKQDVYVMDAIIRGGSISSSAATLTNVRWAKKPDYERLVFDVDAKIPPYFQVGLSPDKGKISLDIKNIQARKISQADLNRVISRSTSLRSVYLAPKIEGELATLDFTTKAMVEVEAFYLMNPPRIVLDIRPKH